MTKTHTAAPKVAAVLWVTWGFVHALAGAMTLISAAAMLMAMRPAKPPHEPPHATPCSTA